MEKQPTSEEIAQDQKSRTLSDAELIKKGADYVETESGEPRLEITKEQMKDVKSEMEEDFIKRREESEKERQKNMSEKEKTEELEQKVSDITDIALKNVRGAKINKNFSDKWRTLIEIEKEDGQGNSFNRKYQCEIGFTSEVDKIFVEITEFYSPGVMHKHFSEKFSSALTAEEIGIKIPWSKMGRWY